MKYKAHIGPFDIYITTHNSNLFRREGYRKLRICWFPAGIDSQYVTLYGERFPIDTDFETIKKKSKEICSNTVEDWKKQLEI